MGWGKTCSVEEWTIVSSKRFASYISARVRLHPQHQQYNCVLFVGVTISLTARSWRDVVPTPLILNLPKAQLTDWLAYWLTYWLTYLLVD